MSLQIIEPRNVPLGGLRAMQVRRTLPARERSLIGAWCFVDHYGPDQVEDTGGMVVAPHPHTGLQTVSWLFEGEIEHRDSAGNHAMVRPGEVNLMTAGWGISHSEVSTAGVKRLHGVQLWVALPDRARNGEAGFVHHVPEPVTGPGWSARVLVGSLLGRTSPVATATPLLGAELRLDPGTSLELAVDPAFEHGVLVDEGVLSVKGEELKEHSLGYLAPGVERITLAAHSMPVRVVLLGGEPLGEQIVMWWNFIGRTHEEIVEYRAAWQAQIKRAGAVVGDSQEVGDGRFGVVVGDHLPPIPAPPMPHVRLKTRN